MSLLSVENLVVLFNTDDGVITAVDKIGFELEEGEGLGLGGESGSGKSVTAKSLMQLNPLNTFYGKNSSIRLKLGVGELDVLRLKSSKELVVVRGGAISMIFQEPMTALNPVLTIYEQLDEVLKEHSSLGNQNRRKKISDLLRQVGLRDVESKLDWYPHQFSGGMRQRAMIAMAMSCNCLLYTSPSPRDS